MFKKLGNLIEVRKIIALTITATFICLALKGSIDNKLVEYVVVSVISYYFAKSTALDTPNNDKRGL